MYSISDDSGRPGDAAGDRRLPVLFHLMDVSRPRAPQGTAPATVPLTTVPLTTVPLTTVPLTTVPLTTAPLTTAPLAAPVAQPLVESASPPPIEATASAISETLPVALPSLNNSFNVTAAPVALSVFAEAP